MRIPESRFDRRLAKRRKEATRVKPPRPKKKEKPPEELSLEQKMRRAGIR